MKRIVYLPNPTILFYIDLNGNRDEKSPNYYSDTDDDIELLSLEPLESPRNLELDLIAIKKAIKDLDDEYIHPYFKDLYDRIELYDIVEVSG